MLVGASGSTPHAHLLFHLDGLSLPTNLPHQVDGTNMAVLYCAILYSTSPGPCKSTIIQLIDQSTSSARKISGSGSRSRSRSGTTFSQSTNGAVRSGPVLIFHQRLSQTGAIRVYTILPSLLGTDASYHLSYLHITSPHLRGNGTDLRNIRLCLFFTSLHLTSHPISWEKPWVKGIGTELWTHSLTHGTLYIHLYSISTMSKDLGKRGKKALVLFRSLTSLLLRAEKKARGKAAGRARCIHTSHVTTYTNTYTT